MLKSIEITSKRLRQIPLSERFVEAIHKYFTAEVTKYMYAKPCESDEEAHEIVQQAIKGLEEGTHLQMAIVAAESGEFLGCCALHQCYTKTPELAIWIKQEAQGYGYGLEAVQAMIEWVKGYREIEYVRYPVDRRNTASRRIAESYGARMLEGSKVKSLSGVELDIVTYCIGL